MNDLVTVNTDVVAKIDSLKLDQAAFRMIKQDICSGNVTDLEFKAFLEYCKARQIDVLGRECFMFKNKAGKISRITSLDYFLRKAQEDPNFAGIVAEAVYADETYQKIRKLVNGKFHEEIIHEATGKGKLIKAYAIVLFNDSRQPVFAEVHWSHFGPPAQAQKKDPWIKMPDHMLIKVAKVHALRTAYTGFFGGLYSSEEQPVIEAEFTKPTGPKRGKTVKLTAPAKIPAEKPTALIPEPVKAPEPKPTPEPKEVKYEETAPAPEKVTESEEVTTVTEPEKPAPTDESKEKWNALTAEEKADELTRWFYSLGMNDRDIKRLKTQVNGGMAAIDFLEENAEIYGLLNFKRPWFAQKKEGE